MHKLCELENGCAQTGTAECTSTTEQLVIKSSASVTSPEWDSLAAALPASLPHTAHLAGAARSGYGGVLSRPQQTAAATTFAFLFSCKVASQLWATLQALHCWVSPPPNSLAVQAGRRAGAVHVA